MAPLPAGELAGSLLQEVGGRARLVEAQSRGGGLDVRDVTGAQGGARVGQGLFLGGVGQDFVLASAPSIVLGSELGLDELGVLRVQGLVGLGLQIRDTAEGRHQDDQCHRDDRGEGLVALDPLLEFGHRAGLISAYDAPLEEGREVFGQLQHRGVAVAAAVGHGLLADGRELHRHVLPQLVDTLGRTAEHLHEHDVGAQLLIRLAVGCAPREQVVEDGTHRVDVRLRADLVQLAARLFGCHVGGRADHVAVHGDQRRVGVFRGLLPAVRAHVADRGVVAGVQPQVARVLAPLDLRETPVHHIGLTEAPDHDVGRLQVAVDDSLRVREGHRLAHAIDRAQRAVTGPARQVRIGDQLVRVDRAEHGLQVAALDEPHREEAAPTGVHAELVNGHDSGVVELAGDLGLLEEARQLRVVRRRVSTRRRTMARDDLHRQVPSQVAVPDFEYGAHATAPDLFAVLVAELGGRHVPEAQQPLLGVRLALRGSARVVFGYRPDFVRGRRRLQADVRVDRLAEALAQALREAGQA